MSQEIREKALSAAVALGGDAKTVVANATAFETFLKSAGAPASALAKAVASPAATKTAAAPVKDAKPVGRPPKAAAASKKDEIDPDQKKLVGDKVNELLKANLRDQVVELLASFEGAQSATGIVKQGQEAVDSFMAQADELLTSAVDAGNLAD